MKLLDDPFLKPYSSAIRGRARRAAARAEVLTCGKTSLADWANAHNYFGLHKVDKKDFVHCPPPPRFSTSHWVFREWAPNATAIWLVGDFNGWKRVPAFKLKRLRGSDVWECRVAAKRIRPGDRYHLDMEWPGGGGERIPAYARYVVQDPETKLFEACVFQSGYEWRSGEVEKWRSGEVEKWRSGEVEKWRSGEVEKWRSGEVEKWRSGDHFTTSPLHHSTTPLIYEAHVGMATEEERVGSYREFARDILPRIKAAGYNTVQLMGIMEHPYYGSFGYHVSSFFAASSRFGTPDDLKSLVDTAHGMGLRVIMDLVHSHAVANERDGLSRFDGTDYTYFHTGAKGTHSAWGSRCFDYGKTETLHFLLSNAKFWLEEYRFDGYRFDGVTSMLFWDHGLGDSFTNYGMYFNGSVDDDAWVYLNLANRVIHETNPKAITIAEDVSGMPGVAAPAKDFGIGFDYRMAMGEPDFWFRLAEKTKDDDWPMGGIFYELTNKRGEEKVVSYVESHDQALVGGKTFFFTLADAAIYWGMGRDQHGLEIERAIALHKMARLATVALSGGAYLNFMGNEFGHPEWIDFPREENGWSYAHARRLWSLRDNDDLRFKALADFDAEMLQVISKGRALLGKRGAPGATPTRLVANEPDKVLAFVRGNLLFVFNFHPTQSYTDYGILVPPASDWRHVLDTDELRFSGQSRIRAGQTYAPSLVHDRGELVQQIKLYLPARTAIVFRRV